MLFGARKIAGRLALKPGCRFDGVTRFHDGLAQAFAFGANCRGAQILHSATGRHYVSYILVVLFQLHKVGNV
jgi:hypothetical protein